MPKLALALAVSLLATHGSRIVAQTQGPRGIRSISIGGGAAKGLPQLDADFFAADGPGPHPAVIIIHGGGFTSGTSRNGSEAYCADFLAPAGFAVFSINYRLAPGANFSQMVADVQRWVRYVRHSAAEYDVDPHRIALLGGSAGGYLSNRAGLAVPQPWAQNALRLGHGIGRGAGRGYAVRHQRHRHDA